MVEDFNEFSAIVTNPVERLCLKHFVKTHNSATQFESTPSVSYKDSQDNNMVNHNHCAYLDLCVFI